MLTREERARYERDGHIVIPRFKGSDEIAGLRERATQIVDAFNPDESRGISAEPLPLSRHAFTLHATDGRTVYCPRNWIQRHGRLPVRGFA